MARQVYTNNHFNRPAPSKIKVKRKTMGKKIENKTIERWTSKEEHFNSLLHLLLFINPYPFEVNEQQKV